MIDTKQFTQTLQTAIEARLLQVNTAIPCEVVAVDKATQSVSVKIVVDRITKDDIKQPFDILAEVPIGYTQTKEFCINFPIKTGDTGQLIFNQRQLDHWLINGEIKEPDDTRKHSLDDALFLPNFVNRQNLIPSVSDDNLQIRTLSGNGKIEISKDGRIELTRDGKKVLDTLSQALEVLSTATVTVTGGSSAGTYDLDQQSDWAALKNIIDDIKI